MISLGQNEVQSRSDIDSSALLWSLAGLGGIIGAYYLLSREESAAGETLPTLQPAGSLETIGAVGTEFGNLQTIYHNGKISENNALAKLNDLRLRINQLSSQGIGEPESTRLLLDQMKLFQDEMARNVTLNIRAKGGQA